MNKYKLILLGVLFFAISAIQAQDPVCLPDSSYADASAGVYPGPFHEVLFPDGGIQDIACKNHPFEMTLTAVIQDSIAYAGFDFKLNHLQIHEDGILNLPEGLDYACNPPNCKFESNILGCMIISGTVSPEAETGTYDLKLVSTLVAANGVINIQDTLPQFLIPDSHYYLEVEEEDSENCQELNIEDSFFSVQSFKLVNNPVTNNLEIEVPKANNEKYLLSVLDMNGRVLKQTEFETNYSNIKVMDISGIKTGVYVASLRSERGVSSLKFIVGN